MIALERKYYFLPLYEESKYVRTVSRVVEDMEPPRRRTTRNRRRLMERALATAVARRRDDRIKILKNCEKKLILKIWIQKFVALQNEEQQTL
jgi:hypothetical protein